MPAKVCILTTVHPPFDTRIFDKQAKTLAQERFDIRQSAKQIRGLYFLILSAKKQKFIYEEGVTCKYHC